MTVRTTPIGLEFRGDTSDGDSILEIPLATVGDADIDDENKELWAKVIRDMIDHHIPEMRT